MLPNPVAGDPDLHPNEVQYEERVRHTVDLVSGEHTIEPLNDLQVETARITGFGPMDPEGNVQRAGSVIIESEENAIILESADRRRDATLRDGEAQVRRRHDFARLKGQAPATGVGGRPKRDFTRFKNQASAGGRPKRDFSKFKDQPPASGSSGKSKRDFSKLKGQAAPSGRSRVDDDYNALLASGGGGGGIPRGRGGGGKRRRDEDEDENGRYIRPEIRVTLSS